LDLDGDLPLMLQILCEVHGGHAATPDLVVDGVAVGEGGGDAGKQVSHRSRGPPSRQRLCYCQRCLQWLLGECIHKHALTQSWNTRPVLHHHNPRPL
jgi:hypothetical protein